ncbi:MAG: tRNA (N(6)-L-threonylcarbamoyladenosine(37)-C(2))-methylthiotransferase MtaB [Desulfobacterales bacterium]|nr:tRNA (N(6)-L-threonylcarbamoyladenosine(37)-C(2))-methylthiotransferase MtaB [Desulfobacterales bacterium]
MSRLFKIVTLGCKVNQYESAFVEESLIDLGCQNVNQGGEADLVVINTCIVTARASYQSRQAIRRAMKENPGAVIAAIGCYGQAFPGELSKINGVDLIAGNKGKSSLPGILARAGHHHPPLIVREDFEASSSFEEIPVKGFSDKTRAFLKIQDGCESFCSYCIVPASRGPLRSLDPDKVIRILRDLEGKGYKEVVLTGIHLGEYGSDLTNGIDLTRLLIEIGRNRFQSRIRLSSLEPTEIERDLIELVAGHDWLCRHFHIPLQSGDDAVLKMMNRHYSARMFTRVIHDIDRLVPKVSIGVDVLVGFPGESDRAFSNTIDLLRDLPISYLHVFPYSRREGTVAARSSDHLDNKRIKERAFLLRCLDRKKREMFWGSLMGETFPILTEGWVPGGRTLIRGLSDNYVRFVFPSTSLIKNEIVRVRAAGITEKGIAGQRVVD